MNDPVKKENQEQTKTDKNKKVPVTLDEMEKVAGGAGFWFFDNDREKPGK